MPQKQFLLPFEKPRLDPIGTEHDRILKMPEVEGMRFPTLDDPQTIVILLNGQATQETRRDIERIIRGWNYGVTYAEQ